MPCVLSITVSCTSLLFSFDTTCAHGPMSISKRASVSNRVGRWPNANC